MYNNKMAVARYKIRSYDEHDKRLIDRWPLRENIAFF